MKTTLQHCISLFERGEPFVMVTVLSRQGPAPRRAGARMIIRGNGTSFSSIGGGRFEAAVRTRAGEVLADRAPQLFRFDLTGDIGKETMLCGGSIELLLDYMDPANQGALSAWHAALQAMQTKKRAWMITDVSAGADAEPGILCCADAQGCASGALQPGAALVQQLQKNAGARSPLIIETEKKRYFTEPLAGLQHLYMFGSGHIAQQLAMLSVLAGFKTSVVDDRRDYATRRRFPLADEILLLDSYDEPFADIATDDNSYIVILTRNPSLDKQVLSTALYSGAAYIGMVGSEVKCRAICEELVHEGASPEALSRIHAPIGLSIGAETPEEVAISIAAELIQQRSLHTNSTIH